jgi:hypothetical protein
MKVSKLGGTYIVYDDDVEIKFSNISSSGEAIYAYVRVFITIPVRKLISTTKLNLLSSRSISELTRRLNDVYPYDWSQILQASCTKVIEEFLNPPTPEKLTLTERLYPKFLIDRFILHQSPTLWFAPGGSGKSFLALALAACCENGFDLFGTCEPTKALYLDWETDYQETTRRVSLIAEGLSKIYEIKKEEMALPSYLRMYLPLVNGTEELLETVNTYGYQLLIIDSVAPALGSDLISAAEVTRFFGSVRRLNAEGITTLLITHISKGEKKDNKSQRTPFGSIFFENFPRLTWELRSEYREDDNSFLFGVFCRKSNVGKLEPKGYKLSFLPNCVDIEYIDPEETDNTKQTLTAMTIALLEKQDMTAKELASTLQATPETIWVTLNRLKKKGIIDNMENGKWGLKNEQIPF